MECDALQIPSPQNDAGGGVTDSETGARDQTLFNRLELNIEKNEINKNRAEFRLHYLSSRRDKNLAAKLLSVPIRSPLGWSYRNKCSNYAKRIAA